MAQEVVVCGVGMSRFHRPSEHKPYDQLAQQAIGAAIADAGGVAFDRIQQIYAGYVYGDSCSGQQAAYAIGLSGVPLINVNNNCSTGSTALFLARQAVEAGVVDCALAFGFEQMPPGALGATWADRPDPLGRFKVTMLKLQDASDAPIAAQLFGGAGQAYADLHGTRPETFAKIAEKARQHARHNPFAVFREPMTVDDVLASPRIFGALTRLQCCPPTCGAAAAILCSDRFARQHGLDRTVRMVGQVMTTDRAETFDNGSMMDVVGYDMAARAAAALYDQTGIGPEEAQVVELHDCFTANELISYEALGLTPKGTAEQFIEDGNNTYGGRVVTNPSGGLLSKGHPLGATGLAQCAELVWQLRGAAGARQVEGAQTALQHNLGVGGACVLTQYQRA